MRDAAVTAPSSLPRLAPDDVDAAGHPRDYVLRRPLPAQRAPTQGHACFRIDGRSRPWSEQNDGPAHPDQRAARRSCHCSRPDPGIAARPRRRGTSTSCSHVYRDRTTNLWEEDHGLLLLRPVGPAALPPGGAAEPARPPGARRDDRGPPSSGSRRRSTRHWVDGAYHPDAGGRRGTRTSRPSPGTTRTSTSSRRAPTARSRAPTASCSPPPVSCVRTGPTRTHPTSSRSTSTTRSRAGTAARPLPGRPVRRQSTVPGRRAPVGAVHGELRAALLRARLGAGPQAQAGPSTTCPATSTRRSASTTGPGRRTPRRRSTPRARRCCTRSSTTATTSSSASSSTGPSGYERSVRDLTWSYAAFLSAVRAAHRRRVHGSAVPPPESATARLTWAQ